MAISSPLPEWVDPIIPSQLATQTDRGAAIIGASYVEYHLEKLLLARMRDISGKKYKRLFTGFGPLAGLAAKIEVAYGFGLFGDGARTDLRAIKDIRDLFAHMIAGGEWTFDHPEIQIECDKFDIANKAVPSKDMPPANNRGKFIITVYWLAGQLNGELIANPQPTFSPKFLT